MSVLIFFWVVVLWNVLRFMVRIKRRMSVFLVGCMDFGNEMIIEGRSLWLEVDVCEYEYGVVG